MRNLANAGLALLAVLAGSGCDSGRANPAAEAPPPAQVIPEPDGDFVQVSEPSQFPLAVAVEYNAAPKLVVTGSVSPDVSRTVPVVTLASGRVVDVRARLGDTVRKGQLLLRVRSDDVSAGYSDYRKAVADELLTRKQLARATDLLAHGAIPQSALEAAQDAEDKALATLQTASEHLRLLGNDPDHPSAVVAITAPVSGVITDQQVTQGSSIESHSANPFTISDLSRVWIICDVYENNLPQVHIGQAAEIRLNAYPNQVFTGRVSNIGAILDPNIRTAKVRIEVRNPGIMRIGMFATATFRGAKKLPRAAVPAGAILHLHDRDWVFVPQGDRRYRRVAVVAGDSLPNNMQEILSGLAAGQRVVANALTLQNTADNE
ncbi:MAG TPA: efflux RND transporter periplasmic adaptor subunit [Candidatus Acidoferrum sp.]|jgi:cobalt-zinc-cadmium efflux system membrane fusion protein|nr:efflux RND transporter periplasmic adaptor subunit [Candidatus Acidoferrum sp.]